MINSSREVPGFSFMPAAVNPVMTGGMALYIRYHKEDRDNLEFAHESGNSLLVKTPDRDLCFVRDMHTDSSSRPVDEVWDEILTLNVSSKSWFDYGVDYGMINYVAHMNKPMVQIKRDKLIGENRTKWLCDSGGFQIITGKVNYLDPAKIAEFYNQHTDIGISLDIPNPDMENDELFKQSAQAQKNNNKIMMSVLNKENTELMNVLHGNDAETFMKFHDKVHHPEIYRLSIADLYRGTSMDAVSVFIELMNRLPKQYKHVHVLGIFNPKVSILVARAARKFFPDLIVTSDATSYLMAAHGWEMCLQRNIDKPFERLEVGANANRAKYPSIHRHLSCSCPICSRIKYTDVFAFSRGIPVYFLQYHNKFEMVRFARNVSQYAGQLDDKDYRGWATSIMGNNGLQETLKGLDFIESCAQDGYVKAKKKYQYWMINNRLNPQLKEAGNLIAQGEEQDTEHENISNIKHVKKVLRHYLGLEATTSNEHGKVNKSKDIKAMHGSHEKKKGHHIVNRRRKRAKGMNLTKKQKANHDKKFHRELK